MPVLCQLANPANYRVSTWNLSADPAVAAYWLDLFSGFTARFEQHLFRNDGNDGEFEARWRRMTDEYAAGMAQIRERAAQTGELYTIDLCRFRQAMLNRYGFPDPYVDVKKQENDLAAGLYPGVIERIDATSPAERWPLLLQGLLAGNMFDLGSPATIQMYQRGELSFASSLERIPARPWFIDHADAFIERASSRRPWRQALIFVDNAGADIVLGVIPLARETARRGTRVILAANSAAALNDITIDELDPLLNRLAREDSVLSDLLDSGRLATVASGNDTPLIDLSRVSDACDRLAAQSDLIVLQGMGRGVESNWTEPFRCDVWRIALLKDETVADWIGAKMFDAVCRLDKTSG